MDFFSPKIDFTMYHGTCRKGHRFETSLQLFPSTETSIDALGPTTSHIHFPSLRPSDLARSLRPQAARRDRDFDKADRMREELKEMGVRHLAGVNQQRWVRTLVRLS